MKHVLQHFYFLFKKSFSGTQYFSLKVCLIKANRTASDFTLNPLLLTEPDTTTS